jgi:hypothetical protein
LTVSMPARDEGRGAASDEQRRWDIEEAHRAHDELTSFYGSVNEGTVKSGEATLRACILINGGAAVAILAFMGSVISSDRTSSHGVIAKIAPNLNWFVGGVVAAVAAMGLTYVVNFLTFCTEPRKRRPGSIPTLSRGSTLRCGVR